MDYSLISAGIAAVAALFAAYHAHRTLRQVAALQRQQAEVELDAAIDGVLLPAGGKQCKIPSAEVASKARARLCDDSQVVLARHYGERWDDEVVQRVERLRA